MMESRRSSSRLSWRRCDRTSDSHRYMVRAAVGPLRRGSWIVQKAGESRWSQFGTTFIVAGFASFASRLPLPQVLYSDPHLLVVNKPAGWIIYGDSQKKQESFLLEYLQQEKLGGGAECTFLKPLHRIDQPCTGVVLFAKTYETSTRLTQAWKQQLVTKSYLCVLEKSSARLKYLQQQSTPSIGNTNATKGWHELGGWLLRSNRKGSVSVVPLDAHESGATDSDAARSSQLRRISLEWKLMITKTEAASSPLLLVRTQMGARHMVRALLSRIGKCVIAGDIRYGAKNTVPDRSVALHAWRVKLPSPSTSSSQTTTTMQQQHDDDDKNDGSSGSNTATLERLFEAPLPPLWRDAFGIQECNVADESIG